MTLIEIMVVIVIIGLIAGGAGFAVFRQLEKAKVETTEENIRAIQAAAELWRAQNNSSECPSTDQMVDDGQLRTGKNRDGWDRDFQINCDGVDIQVVSAGKDGEMGTDDDLPKRD